MPLIRFCPGTFLSTLSLRRATTHPVGVFIAKIISIHALLAESDTRRTYQQGETQAFLSTLSLRRATSQQPDGTTNTTYFYPRSPCGERLHYDNYNLHCVDISIHALLAESDTMPSIRHISQTNFYPRSPCGERLGGFGAGSWRLVIFLSTLSLRRATCPLFFSCWLLAYFYPRSPCGERPPLTSRTKAIPAISIHALLAESDHSL